MCFTVDELFQNVLDTREYYKSCAQRFGRESFEAQCAFELAMDATHDWVASVDDELDK